MLARMDIVSVNCPHTPATYHLLSARRLKLFAAARHLVNTARGEVIDEDALAACSRPANSPAPGSTCSSTSPPFRSETARLPPGNVSLLPHMGSATIEGRIDMGEKVIINVKTFMDGHSPPDCVLPSML